MEIGTPLWTAAEINATCGALTARPWYADGLQVDSRDILPGDLFVALKGEALNGHDFVAKAFEKGAVAAIVSETPKDVKEGDNRLVFVDDTSYALVRMAHHARGRAPAGIIGVTGSAGKTSVVQALRQCLALVGDTHSSIKSFNNHVGVPLSLARMPRESRFGVFELGMNKPGEIIREATKVQPDVAIVTTVGSAHQASFANVSDIAEEKASIFGALKQGGFAIYGIDHPYKDDLQKAAEKYGAKAVSVSVTDNADVYPVRMTEHHNCTCLTANVMGTLITYKVAQPGREWVLNSLLILAAVKAIGADLGHAALALASLEAEQGRGREYSLQLGFGEAKLIDDSYNANILSIRAALRRLSLAKTGKHGKRIAVLADMQELGSRSEEIHFSLIADLKKFGVSKVIAFGDQMAAVGEASGLPTERWHNPDASAEQLMQRLGDGDVVMVKGANSAGLSALVNNMLDLSKCDTLAPESGLQRAHGF
ncbi:UDP-N-acetylmuramoyl-tripeptide--D-alanyl-D-alanine ligase [Kordiimonas sp. SCSIO 12603]|uniref:UDP-N-acetylmuramoyl-tripeptide--D-alanyl-D- alanine ligase n=1 Tax=Kordiimonas sp. SCSIO 12603 TaxID=2829596 RepID=UPI00210497AA|nr:UDP-N-acetylmuramoyl-tripeptide--D-alanyl-D-alanine ligase [Kordiimonas sp. SCSIO 12603]UTW58022.1 UDP-N-acetylmuramoyl-tripeptide--D-alanyl-D-alanine ligase [Kordiimonas sp. SCSIO 12603]